MNQPEPDPTPAPIDPADIVQQFADSAGVEVSALITQEGVLVTIMIPNEYVGLLAPPEGEDEDGEADAT